MTLDWLQGSPWAAAYFGLIGLFVGSFLNVCIDRYVAGESIVFPASHCTHCGHRLSALDLIPVLSWLFLRGRCRYCGARLSAAYPLSEILTGLVFAVTVYVLGLTSAAAVTLAAASLFIVLSGIDLRLYILPDRLTIPAAVLALPAAVYGLGADLWSALIGGLAGGVVFWLTALYYHWRTGREGLGLGDAKLMLSLGALAGVERISLVVVLASVAALAAFVAVRLVRGRRAQGMRLAFGPYLCGACWVNLVWGETLWRAWLDIIL